jgi:hypothetical protein
MERTAALSNPSRVQCLVARLAYSDLRASLYRLRSLLAEVQSVSPPLVDLAGRRVQHVRLFVDALRFMSRQAPLLTEKEYATCSETLDAIDRSVPDDPTAACQLAIRLVEAIGREVPCLARV